MSHICRVGLVGRPNVGKSTLFNRLVGGRIAVVADEAGTTRDRLERTLGHNGAEFILFDMAGIEPQLDQTELTAAIQRQVEESLKSADVIVWVVDGRAGTQAQDDQVGRVLRGLHKPVILAANKCDDPKHDIGQYEFAQYGFDPLISLSAIHGRGTHELLDAIAEEVKAWQPAEAAVEETIQLPDADSRELRLALVGRPNVGKSTLLNRLVGSERSVVSPVAGTTRDAVDTVLPAKEVFGRAFTKWQTVRVIDTAGIRRRGKIGHEIEAWSVIRTFDSIDAAEVVLLLIDASEGLVHQDLLVAERIVEAGRPMVLLVNKWDAVLAEKNIYAGTEEEQKEQERFLDVLRAQAPFLHWVHVLFLSAQEGWNTEVIGKLVLKAYQAWAITISQEDLDELAFYLQKMPRLRNLQKVTIEHNRPPVFHVHVEGRKLPHFSTIRYIENALRERFDIGSTPIKIWTVTSQEKRARK